MVKILLSLKQDFFYFLFFLQFALEGETTTGNEGDIALDDLSVFDGSCQEVKDQGEVMKTNRGVIFVVEYSSSRSNRYS